MRYKFNTPKIDDERIITKFLWIPKIIKGELRVLETATFKQIYRRIGWRDNSWENIYWINKSGE